MRVIYNVKHCYTISLKFGEKFIKMDPLIQMRVICKVKHCYTNSLKFGEKLLSSLTLHFIMLQNGQTYFKNLAVFTPQDF